LYATHERGGGGGAASEDAAVPEDAERAASGGVAAYMIEAERPQRFCQRCSLDKGAAIHHCRTCERCVLRFDHHCPWINNCVGERNHAAFLVLLLYVSLGAGYSVLAHALAFGPVGALYRGGALFALSYAISLASFLAFGTMCVAWH